MIRFIIFPAEDFMDIRQFILPGGIGLTHIRVYSENCPDGVPGGGAHVHLACSEIYYVLKGTGSIELLSIDGIHTESLEPHKAVFFRPGIFHRVLNPNRDLELLDIMQNGGLPERGDFVMSFPSDVLASPAAYAQAVRVTNLAEATRRRDLSIKGYMELKAAFSRSREDGQAALRAFYRQARALIAPKVEGFEWALKQGAQNEVKDSLDACDFIKAGRTGYLERSRFGALHPFTQPTKPGMCGELHDYALDPSFLTDGRKVA
ncbi:MAG TPA: cupin [Phycisphaerae bacterium]|jgi:mannose-6-phosphate isomerase-like protein (cupin superfamily)|nr:cupin [Phycisphaerae bacterium]